MLSHEGYEHRCRKPTCGHVERADDSSNRRCPKDGRVLLLRGGAEEEIRRQFPGGARVYWHLHPPFLRALGMKRKLRLGRWARPAPSLLRALRRLRGTAVDPFGPSEVRRVERALIEEYRAMVLRALEMPSLHDAAVAIAELPDLVRGYEAIKLRNVQRFHERAAALGGQTWTRNQTITARRSK